MTEKRTGSDDLDPRFWDRADEVIQLANEQCSKDGARIVSASLLYTAARFNAFIVASNAVDAKEMELDKERAISYFTERYRKMLTENINDHIRNFDRYARR